MPENKKGFSKKLNQRFLQGKILRFLKRHPNKRYNAAMLSRKLHIKNSKDSISKALEHLAVKDKLVSDRNGKFSLNPGHKPEGGHKAPEIRLVGTVDMTMNGGAFVVVSGQERDVYIPKKHLYGALNGDTVRIVSRKLQGYRRPEGRISEVVSRYRTSFMGVFRDFKKYGYVYVEDRHTNIEVKILPKHFNGAQDGDRVVVSVSDFGRPGHYLYSGRVTHIIQADGEHEFRMNSILINNGFDLFFPDEVIQESEHIEMVVSAAELDAREDLRQVWTCTIDPVDAKDFDDALSYRPLDGGKVEIGIHIADVTHYLREGSALDKEAQKRSTSVYLVDRVCPMLPEKLSNDLCSLRPEEDRFTFSAIFVFDPKGNVLEERFSKSIIHSNRRFTYDEVQSILEDGKGTYSEALTYLNTTATKLRAKRFQHGSIDFDSDEVRFVLDDEKVPVQIIKKERKDAHKLVEEFMLLANRKVAEHIGKKTDRKAPPFVYRIHDLPDPEKLSELALLAAEFDIQLRLDTPKQIAASLNKLTSELNNTPLLSVIRPMAIRTMAKAAYSSDNIGHFGLGFTHYTHFTSPIRRYADVLAHRILRAYLEGEATKDANLESRCQYISAKERNAIDAERESVRYKQVEYLQNKLGQRFHGTIRSIIDRGFFVELVDIQIDGLVPFDTLPESFTIHPARIKAVGNQSKRILRIGDLVAVVVVDTDMSKLQIEMRLADDD